MNKYSYLLLLLSLLTLINSPRALAQSLDLQLLDDTISPPPPSTPKTPIPQNPKNTVLRGPKATIYLNSNIVDFGGMTPTNPVIRYSHIKISLNSSYQLIGYQNSYLTTTDNSSFIPNTTCDNGQCTHARSSGWISTLTYGSGISCSKDSGNISCIPGNEDKDTYTTLPFDPHHILAAGQKNSSLKINYKLNVSAAQHPGSYTNIINYILVPDL